MQAEQEASDVSKDNAVSRESMTLQNATNSPLLRLPSELRNMIFAYVFDRAVLCSTSAKGTTPKGLYITTDGKGALSSCSQIHQETANLVNKYTMLNITFDRTMPPRELLPFVACPGSVAVDTLELDACFVTCLVMDSRSMFQRNDWQDKALVSKAFAGLGHIVVVQVVGQFPKGTKLVIVKFVRKIFDNQNLLVSFRS
ncbi:hypothetical protein OPT61_g5424 [Boeremia exigua]|uniref:Uncharacterized protein n=1 Tax=Boeremia exigua TaxID=749465 RepID=A0ACC2IAF7_9PLEO|nr:hypothetical protein OPT61_g5424 [Boeremia exigua]